MAQGWTPAIDTRRRKLFNSVIATLRDGGRSTVIASAGNPVGFLHLLELYRFERTISDVDTGHMTRVLDVLRPRVRVRGAARSPDANFPL
jgi:NADPH:quinone reductase-like Zn-dependent oxidoreductase